MNESDYHIVIVGGGMVGCALACAIASNPLCADLKIAVLEASSSEVELNKTQFSARVVALSNKSRKFLQELGVWDDVVENRHCVYKSMEVWDGEGAGKIQFDCSDIRENQLGYIVENNIVVWALRKKIQDLAKVEFIPQARVKNIEFSEETNQSWQNIIVEESHVQKTISSTLILAADGAHSSIREIAMLATREWDYGHSAIVTTVGTALSHQYTARQRFNSTGPVAFLPLFDAALGSERSAHYCSLVWSADTGMAAKLMAMKDEKFSRELELAFEGTLGNIESVDQRYCIPLRQRYAKKYIRPGLALVGDAAHTIHPLAGQGVNLGLYDALALTEEIARSKKREFPLDDYSILQRYERKRQTHNLLAMATMEGFKRLFASEDPAVRLARNIGMNFFDQNAWLKSKLMEVASG